MGAQTPPTPMRLNFGTPDAAEAESVVVGRQDDVRNFWDALHAGSIRLVAERRMGKTWLVKLALSQKPDWAQALFVDAQGDQSVPQFVHDINRALHERGHVDASWWECVQDWFRRNLYRTDGVGVGEYDLKGVGGLDPWSDLLEGTCRRMVEAAKPGKAVLIVDEFPFFLDRLVKAEQRTEAIRLLDVFRELRQQLAGLRIVFCGSLGLHIVLDDLYASGYSGRPVNDMPPFEVGPLSDDWARYLAACLLLGENIPCASPEECGSAVATTASGVPFYIQHVVKWMKEHRAAQAWDPGRIGRIPEEAAIASGDPFELTYYDARLDTYYPDDLAERARAALDVLSAAEGGLGFNALLNLVRHNPRTLTIDPKSLLDVLRTLKDDHYLTEADGRWRFKLDIVRRGWRKLRGELGL